MKLRYNSKAKPLNPELPVQDAIVFVLERHNRVKVKSIAGWLKTYGWVPVGHYIEGRQLSHSLRKLEGEGMVQVDRSTHELKYSLRGVN